MSPYAREEIHGGQPNVSDAAVGLLCLWLFGFMVGYGFAKYHTENFGRQQQEERK